MRSISARCQDRPKPTLARSLIFHDTEGLKFTVMTSEDRPWKRPTKSSSYSVFSPKGTLSAKPKLNAWFTLVTKKRFGTNAPSPASPPFPARAGLLAAAGTLPLFVNLVDGEMACPATRKCAPRGSRAIPAGFHHTVDASSAAAAAPA